MRKKILLAILCCLIVLAGCGSTPATSRTIRSYDGWIVVKVGETATFQMPPTLEVQSDAYRQRTGNLGIKVNNENIICQQKGLNEQGPGPANKRNYARVLFTTFPMEPAGPVYGQKLGLSAKEIKDFEALLRQSIVKNESNGLGNQMKFLRWEPLKVETINGIECLHIAYERQLQNNPVVRVDNYKFFNKDKIHNLTISSRISEKNIWHVPGHDIGDIVNTLQIIPR